MYIILREKVTLTIWPSYTQTSMTYSGMSLLGGFLLPLGLFSFSSSLPKDHLGTWSNSLGRFKEKTNSTKLDSDCARSEDYLCHSRKSKILF